MLVNQIEVVKPTTNSMEIVSCLPDFVVDNETDFKKLIDWLYKLFWDNGQKIKSYAKNKELDIINAIRKYYYHDIEHGEIKRIKVKYDDVKKVFKEACQKNIPENAKDWQKIQEFIYDKLIQFLSCVEIKEIES